MKPKPRPMPRRYFARTVPVTLPKAQTLCFRECREADYRSLLSLVLLLAGAAIAFVSHCPGNRGNVCRSAYKPADQFCQSLSPAARHNPVDWYPWGDEAIAKAKENKPIFVSIGYSTCYWCHVAERTIYSDPAIAALMNQWFVNIKIDREERPDLDQTFMIARQILTKLGRVAEQPVPDAGPQALLCRKLLSTGGPRQGTLGFPSILKLIHDNWESRPDKIKAAARRCRRRWVGRRTPAASRPAS